MSRGRGSGRVCRMMGVVIAVCMVVGGLLIVGVLLYGVGQFGGGGRDGRGQVTQDQMDQAWLADLQSGKAPAGTARYQAHRAWTQGKRETLSKYGERVAAGEYAFAVSEKLRQERIAGAEER